VGWTDGVDFVEGKTTYDALVFFGTYANSAWTFKLFDNIPNVFNDIASTVWTVSGTPSFVCTAAGTCTGDLCATRPLVKAGEFDLPFKPNTDFLGIWKSGTFTGIVESGAVMSVGLALLSAAGAALTLI